MFEQDKKYWDRRYKHDNSGPGSYGDEVSFKLQQIANLDFKSVLDIGCGDGNFYKRFKKVFPGVSYTGLDISDRINSIEKLEVDDSFRVIEDLNFNDSADLIICSDVLFHITDDEDYDAFVKKLMSIPCKYRVVVTYKNNLETHVDGHLKLHNFDYPGDRFEIPQDKMKELVIC